MSENLNDGEFGPLAMYLTVVLGVAIVVSVGVVLLVGQLDPSAPPQSFYRMTEPWNVGPSVSASEALANDKATLVIFYSVEECQERYCQTPEAIVAQAGLADLQRINVLSVLVYAAAMDDDQSVSGMPMLNPDEYAVEPYANWLPQFTQTKHGWGLDAPAVVLAAPDGAVLHRGDEHLTATDVVTHLDRLALSK